MATKANGKSIQRSAPETATAVALTQDSLPAFMKGQAGKGLEKINPEDYEIPRAKLLQALSPEFKGRDDLRAGMWYHAVSEESLGRELVVVPVFVDQSYILWRPRKAGGGILARAQDGVHWSPANARFDVVLDNGSKVTWTTAQTVAASRLAEWGSMDPNDPNSPPAATRMYNVVVVAPDFLHLSPFVVTMQRASIKTARKLLSKLKLSAAPIYGLRLKLSSIADKNSQGQEYLAPTWTMDGLVTNEGLLNQCRDLYTRIAESGIKVKDLEGTQGEEPGGDISAPPGQNAF